MRFLDARNPYLLPNDIAQKLPVPQRQLAEWAKSQGYDSILNPTGTSFDYHVLSPDQIYAPYVAPAMRRIPSANPILAAMAGSNALQTAGGY